MAKWIVKCNNDFYRIVENDDAKDFYLGRSDMYSADSISDSDVESIKRGTKEFQSLSPLNSTLVDTNIIPIDFSQDNLGDERNNLVNRVKRAIENNENPPASWQNGVNTLLDIDVSSLTYPVNANNWVDALEKNSIVVPLSTEF